MTVKELIEVLKTLDENMDIEVRDYSGSFHCLSDCDIEEERYSAEYKVLRFY